MFRLTDDRKAKGRELRSCVVETLREMMSRDDKVVALEADLGGASGFTKLKTTRPIWPGWQRGYRRQGLNRFFIPSALLPQEEFLTNYICQGHMQGIR